MVRLVYLAVFRVKKRSKKSDILCFAANVADISYFKRDTILDFMKFFTSEIVPQRLNPGIRMSVPEDITQQQYMCHVYLNYDHHGAVVISDHQYPRSVAFTLLSLALEAVGDQTVKDNQHTNKLARLLATFQNPVHGSRVTKIEKEMDETKQILHQSVNALLERHEKLEDLVARSEVLTTQSKDFFKLARKTNKSCCKYR